MNSITTFAPAKINLTLEIVGVKPNGYHLLEMIMQSISLFDEVTVTKRQNAEILISCDDENVPTDHTNIVYKAAVAFFAYTKICSGVDINITKNIPSQAGLGGGSSDGAATLIALNRIYQTDLSKQVLAEIGQTVGSDIPFCIYGNTAFVRGFGERVMPISSMPDCFIVVAKPSCGVDTANAYKLADSKIVESVYDADPMIDAIKIGNIDEIARLLFNRFERVIGLDMVQNIKQAMIDYGALNSAMTGSGSAVFAIFINSEAAQKCVDKIRSDFTQTEVFLTKPYFTE